MSKVGFDRKCDIERFFGNRHDLNVRCGIEIAAKSDVDRSGTKSFLLAILSHADEDDLRKRDLGTEAAQKHRHGLRSAERGGGKECDRTCRSRWAADREKKKMKK